MAVDARDILIVGGYGEVGHLLTADLESAHPGRVVIAGRHPELAPGLHARRVDVDDPTSVEEALEGVRVVAACVQQRAPHLLRAAVRRGLAYTSIAPPWMEWPALEPLRKEARETGARVILAAGIEPGISSVLARDAADRLGGVDTIETALLLGVGDAYGADSMAFIMEELAQPYAVQIEGRPSPTYAFGHSKPVEFPAPFGRRSAYTMPFRDQLYYPHTLGARTSIARLALDPPWLGGAISALSHMGGRAWLRREGMRRAIRKAVGGLRSRRSGRDQFALLVEVAAHGRLVRTSLTGRRQAQATAAGAEAVLEALCADEVKPGVWLAEEVLPPERFLARIARRGLVAVRQG